MHRAESEAMQALHEHFDSMYYTLATLDSGNNMNTSSASEVSNDDENDVIALGSRGS